MKQVLWLSLLLIALFTSCASRTESAPQGADNARHASLLRLDDRKDFSVATILDPADTSRVMATYILVPRGARLPEGLPKGDVIRTPLKSAVLYSSVVAKALDELGDIDMVKGVTDAQYFAIPEIKAGLASGQIQDLGSPSSPNLEKLIAMRPDAVILNLYEGMNVPDFAQTGVKTIRLLDNREATPLGRAEWIKLIGALAGKRQAADSIFRAVEKNYRGIMAKAKKAPKRPSLLTENMYEGVWYVPGGASCQAAMLRDAGAGYLWDSDTNTGSISLSFEQVIQKARDADVWLLKVYGKDLDRAGLIAMDKRYAHFKAVDAGRVYYVNTARDNIFDDTAFHPDILLEEYFRLFDAVARGEQPQGLKYYRPMVR